VAPRFVKIQVLAQKHLTALRLQLVHSIVRARVALVAQTARLQTHVLPRQLQVTMVLMVITSALMAVQLVGLRVWARVHALDAVQVMRAPTARQTQTSAQQTRVRTTALVQILLMEAVCLRVRTIVRVSQVTVVQIARSLIRVLRRQFLTTMVLQAFFSAQMVLSEEQLGHAVVLVTQDTVIQAAMLVTRVLHHQFPRMMVLPVSYTALMVVQLLVLLLRVVAIALVRLAGRI